MLDLSAGVYDVADEIGTAMWSQLTQPPTERDIPGLAQKYEVPSSVIESDLKDFAAAQLAAGRLVTEMPRETPLVNGQLRRRRPSASSALWERASADRDVRRSFAGAYATRTGPAADNSAPRVDVERLTKIFRVGEGLYPARNAPLDCLPRSLAFTRFLRRAGWQAQHVIGVALYPFEAHAWVEMDGVPLDESATYLRRFSVIAQA